MTRKSGIGTPGNSNQGHDIIPAKILLDAAYTWGADVWIS